MKKLKKTLRGPISWGAFILLCLFILCAIFAPFISPKDPEKQDLLNRYAPPFWIEESSFGAEGSTQHILGTDDLGRDVLSRLIYGSRTSISVGVLAALLAGGIGITIGLISGYFPKLDGIIMRIADIQLAFPQILLSLSIVAIFGGGFTKLIIVLGITGWVSYARVIRSEVLSMRSSDYIIAAQTVGVSQMRILWRHVLPNIIARAVTIGTNQMATAIITESSLSFLGLGISPNVPTWGNMLQTGQMYVDSAWWLSVFPGLCIMLTVLSINLLGDALKDSIVPKAR